MLLPVAPCKGTDSYLNRNESPDAGSGTEVKNISSLLQDDSPGGDREAGSACRNRGGGSGHTFITRFGSTLHH